MIKALPNHSAVQRDVNAIGGAREHDARVGGMGGDRAYVERFALEAGSLGATTTHRAKSLQATKSALSEGASIPSSLVSRRVSMRLCRRAVACSVLVVRSCRSQADQVPVNVVVGGGYPATSDSSVGLSLPWPTPYFSRRGSSSSASSSLIR